MAISHRSVLQLSADLEQSLALENPSAWSAPRLEHPSPRSKPTSEHEVAEEQLLVESPLPSPSRPSEAKPVPTGPNNNASCPCFTPSHNAQTSNNVEELAQRILGEVGGRIIEELSEKIDKLSAEVNRLQQENRAMKIEQNDNLSNALEKIGEYQNSLQRAYRSSAIATFIPDAFVLANELKYRDVALQERLERSIRTINQESRDNLLQTLDATLSRNTRGLQAVAEQTQQRGLDSMRQTVTQTIVPAIGRCPGRNGWSINLEVGNVSSIQRTFARRYSTR